MSQPTRKNSPRFVIVIVDCNDFAPLRGARLLGEEARGLVLHVHNDDDGGEGDEQEGDPASKRF